MFKLNPFTGQFDEVGGGTPGGVTTEIQFNNAGAFDGTDKMFWDDTEKQLNLGVASPAHGVTVGRLNIEDTYTNSGETQTVSFAYTKATINGIYTTAGINSANIAHVASGITNTGSAYGLITQSLRNTALGGAGDSGTLSVIVGQNFNYGHDNAFAVSPTTNKVYGLFFDPKAESGTIDEMYDIFIDSLSTGGAVTARWSMYQEDTTTKNYFGSQVGIGTTAPVSGTQLDLSATTGGIANISRNDTSVASADMIGKIQFWNNDSTLTTQNIYANIEVQAAGTIAADAARGRMIFRTTPNTVAASPTEAMRITDAQRVDIGASADPSTAHVRITGTNTPTIDELALVRTTTNDAAVTRSALDISHTQTHASGSITNTGYDIEQDIRITASGGTVVASTGAHSISFVPAAAGGTVTSTAWRFQRFAKAGVEVWDVNAVGIHQHRYNGTVAVTLGGPGVSDTAVVAFAENLPDTGYSISLTGNYTTFVYDLKPYDVRSFASIDETTRAVGGFTGMVSYTVFDMTTNAWVVEYNNWAALKAAFPGALFVSETNIQKIDWAVRRN
jgi:hypothetical protein